MSGTAAPSKKLKFHQQEWKEDIPPRMSCSKFVCLIIDLDKQIKDCSLSAGQLYTCTIASVQLLAALAFLAFCQQQASCNRLPSCLFVSCKSSTKILQEDRGNYPSKKAKKVSRQLTSSKSSLQAYKCVHLCSNVSSPSLWQVCGEMPWCSIAHL